VIPDLARPDNTRAVILFAIANFITALLGQAIA
jgi:hypothetical protein